MARVILVIEPDVDSLGALAEALRARGMTVLLARDVPSAAARVRAQQPDIVFLSSVLAGSDRLEAELSRDPALVSVPRVVLVRAPGEPLREGEASYDDVDKLVARALDVKPLSSPPESNPGELRGDVGQVPLVDLLQLLTMNRRTGVLEVSTQAGAGELRLSDGEVLDAVYRRLEGEKAFYRMLGEREGSFVFQPGGPPAVARLGKSTSALLMEAMRHKDEVARFVRELDPQLSFLAAGEPPPPDAPRVARDLHDALAVARTLDDLLDEVPAPDLDVLVALRGLMEAGLVRTVDVGRSLAHVAPPSQIPVVRALVARLVREGFALPARIAIASSAARVTAFGHALLRVQGAVPPQEPPPSTPVPHDLGSVRLGEGVDLGVLGVPDVAAFSPLWALALPATLVLVHLDAPGSAMLEACSRALELRTLSAKDLVPDFDEADPARVAALLRAVVEQGGAS